MLIKKTSPRRLGVLSFWCACIGLASTLLLSIPARSDDRTYNQTIAIPAAAGSGLKAAADDAAQALRKMTGKDFQIVQEYSHPGIQLLRSSDSQAPGDAVKQLETKGREPFVIRSTKSGLQIIANGDAGLTHGLYFYLDQLGARWFFPNENWTIVPQRADVRLTINRLVEPAFKLRTFFGTGGFGRAGINRFYDLEDRVPKQWADWMRRNRFGGEFSLSGHAGEDFNLRQKATLLAHPEYFAEVNGQRTAFDLGGGKVNLGAKHDVSNPDLVKLFIADRLDKFAGLLKNDPSGFAISVEPADGGGYCNSGPCTQIGSGSISDQVFYLANETAKAVAEKYPGRRVSLLAYGFHAAPPSFDLQPNVFVSLVPYGFNYTGFTPEELVEGWSKKLPELGMYDYWSIPDWAQSLPSFDYLHVPAQKIRFWHAHHVVSFMGESSYSAGAVGIPWYLASRLMWDPQTDVNALLADFYSKAFGPAEAPMKRMLERWSDGFWMIEPELALSFRDLQEARRLAKNESAVMARLDDYGRYLHYLRLWYEFRMNPAKSSAGGGNGPALALTKYMWSIYDSAMVEPFRMTQLMEYRFSKDPELNRVYNLADKNAEGWKNIHQVAHDEIEALLADDAEKYHSLDFERRSFSGESVPLPAELAVKSTNGRPVPMYFFDPVDFDLLVPPGMKSVPLTLGVGRGHPMPMKLYDSNGKKIYEHVVPAESQETFTLPFPQPGRYTLKATGAKVLYCLHIPGGLGFTTRTFRNSQGFPAPRLYFYVPRGSKTVAFYLSYFMVPRIYESDGQELTPRIRNAPGIVVVDVPPGQDGKVWSLGDVRTPQPMSLLNVPSAFAVSPDQLLVPASALKNQ
jgi:hypothetical protein